MKNIAFKGLTAALLAAFAISHLGCASGELVDSNNPEAAFKAAEEYEKDERFEDAITKFSEVKNKHPYSRFAVEAELKIADIYFKRENFADAQTAYQLFKDFHPKHPRTDYVTYRLAMSFYNQLPATADRDLSPSFKAMQYFDEVVASFPQSQYVAESKEKKNSCLKLLAEKESYIGNFYFIRGIFDSAYRRYSGLLTKYPNQGFDELAMYRASISAFESGDKENGIKFSKELIERFPKGEYTADAKEALQKYGGR
ncbi:MAG: outer membrane protein assembly factor BamD [Oligoflexia bacterium]|nr:outer membrane protein assembly factor BamD [Oligoflexia bacterium]